MTYASHMFSKTVGRGFEPCCPCHSSQETMNPVVADSSQLYGRTTAGSFIGCNRAKRGRRARISERIGAFVSFAERMQRADPKVNPT